MSTAIGEKKKEYLENLSRQLPDFVVFFLPCIILFLMPEAEQHVFCIPSYYKFPFLPQQWGGMPPPSSITWAPGQWGEG